MHTQVLGLATAGLAGLLLVPAGASAMNRGHLSNPGADLSALTAYRAYLSSLTANNASAAARADQVIAGVTNTCPEGLTDLSKLSAVQLKASALTAFGNEVDADLDLAYISAGNAALNKFATALTGLSWSTTTEFNTTEHLISGERALLGLARPHICVDAIALDAAPLSEPTTTRRFLARYRRASTALNTDLSDFQSLLTQFETKSENKLVAQIDVLVTDYSSQSTTAEQADATAVLQELGVDS